MILVLGDLFIDETWRCKTTRLSREAPIPVASITTKKPILSPGAAGLVAQYLSINNIPSHLISVISREGKDILLKNGISFVNIAKTKSNIRRTRYVEESSRYHLLKVANDLVVSQPDISDKILQETIYNHIKLYDIDIVMLLDYRRGLFGNMKRCQNIIDMLLSNNIPVYVDTRGNALKFKRATAYKVNLNEFNTLLSSYSLVSGYELRKELDTKLLIVTKAQDGAEIYTEEEHFDVRIPLVAGIPDVTGAGDVFDANFCYYYFMQKNSIIESLKKSVIKSTEYVHKPIETRLWK